MVQNRRERWRARGPSATARTLLLAGCMSVLSLAVLPHLPVHLVGGLELSWWQLAAIFVTTELLSFHIEISREAHSFSLSEVALALGLLFSGPVTLVTGRLVGEALVLSLRERQSSLKVVLNLAMFAAECVVAVAVFGAVGHPRSVSELPTWLAVLAAVAAADGVGILVVSKVITWHGGEPRWRQLAVAGAVTFVANSTLALVAALLLTTTTWAVGLLALLAVVMWSAYGAYANLSQRYSSLQMVYDFTRTVTDSLRGEAVVEDRIQTRRNDRLIKDPEGRPVSNRNVFRVAGVGPGGQLTVRRELGGDPGGKRQLGPSFQLPGDYVAERVQLAYASTVHAAQGRTTDTALGG